LGYWKKGKKKAGDQGNPRQREKSVKSLEEVLGRHTDAARLDNVRLAITGGNREGRVESDHGISEATDFCPFVGDVLRPEAGFPLLCLIANTDKQIRNTIW